MDGSQIQEDSVGAACEKTENGWEIPIPIGQ